MPVINTALNVTVGDWKARMHVTNTVTKIMVSGAKTEHTHTQRFAVACRFTNIAGLFKRSACESTH